MSMYDEDETEEEDEKTDDELWAETHSELIEENS